MGKLVIRNGLSILGSLGSGAGDPQLTLDSTTKEVGQVPATDLSVYLSTTLLDGKILVGNASNIATAVTPSGNIALSNTGALTINTGVILDNHINNLAGITRSKLASGAARAVIVNDGVGAMSELAPGTNNYVLRMVGGVPTWSAGSANAFTQLSDVPASYAGQTLKLVRVNAAETGLEFVSGAFWSLASGGTLTGANTINQNTNTLNFTNGQFTISQGATTSNTDGMFAVHNTNTSLYGMAMFNDSVSSTVPQWNSYIDAIGNYFTGTRGSYSYNIYTNGTANVRMMIDNAGKVGIGTAPSTVLHVSGNAPYLTLQSANDQPANFVFSNSANTIKGIVYYTYSTGEFGIYNAQSTGFISFTSSGSETVRMDGNNALVHLTSINNAVASSTGTQVSSNSFALKTGLWTGAASTSGWFTWRNDASTSVNQSQSLTLYNSVGASPSFATKHTTFSDDGGITLNQAAGYIDHPTGSLALFSGSNIYLNSSTSSGIRIGGGYNSSGAGTVLLYSHTSNILSATSGTNVYFQTDIAFTVASGTGTFKSIELVPRYNFTGTYSGTVYGIDYNPTLTGVTGLTNIAFRATSGQVLIGGTTITNGSVLLDLQSTTRALVVPRMTTTQKDAITTKVGGMHIWDSTLSSEVFYDNITLGFGNVATTGGIRTIQADGSDSNIDLYVKSKGTSGRIRLISGGSAGGLIIQSQTTPNNQVIVDVTGISTNYATSISDFTLLGANGISGSVTGQKLLITAGTAYGVGNNNGGDIVLTSGVGANTGAGGTINILGSDSGSGTAGSVLIAAGGINSSGTSPGSVTIRGGNSNVSGVSASNVTVVGGAPSVGNASGGAASVVGGVPNGSGTGGQATLAGGSASTASSVGGLAHVHGGDATGSAATAGKGKLTGGDSAVNGVAGGDVDIIGGTPGTGTAAGGSVNIKSGAPVGGAAETSVNIQSRSTGKLGFYAVTAITRPTTGSGASGFTANAGTAVNDASTFDGYTLKQVVKALRDFGLLT